jgi:Domain of unknown function (DUF932)
MSYFRQQRYASNFNSGRRAMTMDELRAYAPSAFATSAHESRSQRFTYIPTVDVIEGMMRAGFQPFQAMQGGSRIEGKAAFTKHLIRFRHPDADLTNSDALPEVVLINAHDGTSSYKLIGGVFRLVCANGLIVADSTIGSLTVPHKGDIVDKVIEGSFEIVGQSRNALNTIETWKQLQLTNGEQQVFSEVAHDVRFGRNVTDDTTGETRRVVDSAITPAQMLTARRSDDMRNDLYSVFNRVQENAIRGGLRPSHYQRGASGDRVRRVPTREVRGIDQNVNINRALWALTQRMAEIKSQERAA